MEDFSPSEWYRKQLAGTANNQHPNTTRTNRLQASPFYQRLMALRPLNQKGGGGITCCSQYFAEDQTLVCVLQINETTMYLVYLL